MLVELEARGFRNLEPLEWSLGGGRHLILGANGAGKTSLLEAIYLLATTRSFRTSQVADCRRHGSAGFRLSGEVVGERRVRLDAGWDAARRYRRVNGDRSSLAEHLAVLPVVCWTASSLEVLAGPPAERRRMIDRGLVGLRPASIEILGRYRQALAEKRKLLLHRGGELEPWNELLATAASEIITLRERYVEQLRGELSRILELCGLGFSEVDLRYRPSPVDGLEGTMAILAAFRSMADQERRRQRPLIGPHRDELEISWKGRPLRRVASAGERKAIGLALLAAQGDVLRQAGRSPTYLLDDADIELDRGRLESIWRAFEPADQLIATSNREQIWQGLDLVKRWFCENGRLAS